TMFLTAGRAEMIREAAAMPERLAFYQSEYGLDLSDWSGYETAGYRVTRVEAEWPTWLMPFSFMPLRDRTHLHDMLRYDRHADAVVTSPSGPVAQTPAGR
ncbi:MAG: hypothetical protein AAGK78_11925, partial [Planctomycetota bacterium]